MLVRESICSAFARQALLPIISDKSLSLSSQSLSSQSLPLTLNSLALILALLFLSCPPVPPSILLTDSRNAATAATAPVRRPPAASLTLAFVYTSFCLTSAWMRQLPSLLCRAKGASSHQNDAFRARVGVPKALPFASQNNPPPPRCLARQQGGGRVAGICKPTCCYNCFLPSTSTRLS